MEVKQQDYGKGLGWVGRFPRTRSECETPRLVDELICHLMITVFFYQQNMGG